MANMVFANEVKTDRSTLKDEIKEWFDALTGAIFQLVACKSNPYNQPAAQPPAASLAPAMHPVLGQFMGGLLAATGVAIVALYVAQFIDWPSTGVDLLLKVVSWL
jgi:hypothetical protein